MTNYHKNLTESDIHIPNAFTYTDATQRLNATGFVASDVKKWALDSDTNLYHVLTNHSPITWEGVSPKTGASIGDLVKLVDVAGAAGLPAVNGTQLLGLLKTSITPTINPSNLLVNGNFEDWYNGTTVAPTGWVFSGTAIARESSIKKLGTYAAKLTRSSGTSTVLYQRVDTSKGISYWKGRQITLGCWVYCTTASTTRLRLSDTDNFTESDYHTGDSTWQFLTVTRTVGTTSTALYAQIIVDVDGAAYFDGAMCVEGPNAFAFSPQAITPKQKIFATGRAFSLGSGTQVITDIGFRPKMFIFAANSTNGGHKGSIGFDDGAYHVCIIPNYFKATVSVYIFGEYDVVYGAAAVTAISDDGFTLTWWVSGNPSDSAIIYGIILG